jgi:hypothetical protein
MRSQLPDFDTLRRMARDNPDGLEALRRKLVDELLDDAGPERRQRLEGLQFRIDMERRRAANPLAATIRLSSMMRDSLLRLQQAINTPEDVRATPARSADVLGFPQSGVRTASRDGIVRR